MTFLDTFVQHFFQPWGYAQCVAAIPLDVLKTQGITHIFLDRDNTCLPYHTKEVPQDIQQWFAQARERGFTLCLVSNNFYAQDVKKTAEQLGVKAFDRAMKPFPFTLSHACRSFKVDAEHCVFVGDQLLTDILAAHFAHIRSIRVDPQLPHDNWYTRIFRMLERHIEKHLDSCNAIEA